jgi:pSer/pThr/pTyr-binding forkhead associated (FHA) protein
LEGNVSDYVLEIVEGPEAGRLIPLNGPTELGRDPSAGVALLQDELISRRHAKITPVEDGLQVEDLDSQNGTFVDGDQIYSPAHVSLGHQLLVGVSVLELRKASEARQQTGVRPIPVDLTSFRPLPSAEDVAVTAVRRVPTLQKEEETPTYVPANAYETDPSAQPLLDLLDVHTKGKARGAPLGILVLVAFAVILYLALH